MIDQAKMLLCPDCHESLVAREFHAVVLDICPECAGVWFAGGGLETLKAQGSGALFEVDRAAIPDEHHHPHIDTERWCPVCPQPLQRYSYATESPIQIDACVTCHGTWVEKGELTQIQAWTQLQRLPKYVHASRSADDMALELAQATMEHQQFMERAHALTAFFRCCVRRGYWHVW